MPHDPTPRDPDDAISTCQVADCGREVYRVKESMALNRWGTEVYHPAHWRHTPRPHVKVRKVPTLRQLRTRIEALADRYEIQAAQYRDSDAVVWGMLDGAAAALRDALR